MKVLISRTKTLRGIISYDVYDLEDEIQAMYTDTTHINWGQHSKIFKYLHDITEKDNPKLHLFWSQLGLIYLRLKDSKEIIRIYKFDDGYIENKKKPKSLYLIQV